MNAQREEEEDEHGAEESDQLIVSQLTLKTHSGENCLVYGFLLVFAAFLSRWRTYIRKSKLKMAFLSISFHLNQEQMIKYLLKKLVVGM